MISITYSTRTSNPQFKDHLTKTSGLKDIEVIEVINNGEFSLAKVYNDLIDKSKFNICVCVHDDIQLESGWGKKLLKDFSSNPDAAIIGKAGTVKMPESGTYWENMQTDMVGCVTHKIGDENPYKSEYSIDPGSMIEVVTIDGLFMAFDKTKIVERFDETIPGFHFYDHGFCIPNWLKGVKIFVSFSFNIQHASGGITNDQFEKNRIRFIMKYSDVLPLSVTPKIFYPKSKKIVNTKPQSKVTVIIPHIHKNELLFKCIDSLIESTVYNNYEVIVADTGSSNKVIKEIKEKYNDNTRIRLVEYDYYNFAKINNDVVKNHVSKDTELILFLNNDVEFLSDCDVLTNYVNGLKSFNNAFSIGCRLYFGIDKPLQHAGMFAYISKEKSFEITHYGLQTYYKYHNKLVNLIGSTGACLMVRKNVFEKLGMFNEGYTSCFEDVEINMKSIVNGHINLFDGNSVALHKESQTRNEDPENIKKLQADYVNHLLPYVNANFEKLKTYIHQMN